jgi:hypothetical protein
MLFYEFVFLVHVGRKKLWTGLPILGQQEKKEALVWALLHPVVELLEEVLEVEPDEVEEPMFGQLCPLYVVAVPLDVDDVFVLAVDCANEANPITNAEITRDAMIVTITRFRRLGRKKAFPDVDPVMDNFLFFTSLWIWERKNQLT